MPTPDEKKTDDRTPAQLLRQWEKLNKVKRQLIQLKLLNGDATPLDVVAVIRTSLPADAFA